MPRTNRAFLPPVLLPRVSGQIGSNSSQLLLLGFFQSHLPTSSTNLTFQLGFGFFCLGVWFFFLLLFLRFGCSGFGGGAVVLLFGGGACVLFLILVRPSKASSSVERRRTTRGREVAAATEVGTTVSNSHYSTYLQIRVI